MLAYVTKSSPIKQDLAEDCTTRGILSHLKENGPCDAATLAGHLGITVPGIRQHLYDLQERKMVDFCEEARPMGRPAKIWQLTRTANDCFPDNHAAVTLNLIESARHVFGQEGLCQMLSQYAKNQVQTYRKRVGKLGTLRERLDALVSMRNDEGYMAQLCLEDNGDFLFVENHCPIACVAASCDSLCDGELNMLRDLLGRGVQVDRTEHMMSGERRCVYRIAVGKN